VICSGYKCFVLLKVSDGKNSRDFLVWFGCADNPQKISQICVWNKVATDAHKLHVEKRWHFCFQRLSNNFQRCKNINITAQMTSVMFYGLKSFVRLRVETWVINALLRTNFGVWFSAMKHFLVCISIYIMCVMSSFVRSNHLLFS